MASLQAQQQLVALVQEVIRLGAWLILLAVVFLPLERLFALHPRNIFCKSLTQDLSYFFISGLVPGLLMVGPLYLAAYGAHSFVPWRLQSAVAALPLWQRALAGLLVSELGFYRGHRWMHRIPFLWRFHSIHHSAEQIYFLTSSRAHPIDNVFIRLCGFMPVYLLGIATPLTQEGGTVAALLVLVLTMWGFFIHSNLRWQLGPLEWIVATPHFHHWHHPLGEQRDRNYASMLPLMDWIFGTYHLPRNRWPSAYGIEATLPRSLAGQLMYPIIPAPHKARLSEPPAANR